MSQRQGRRDAAVVSTLQNFSHFGSNQSGENILLLLLSSSHACVVPSSTCDFSFLSVSPLTPAPALRAALIGPRAGSLLRSALIIFTFLHRVISLKLWRQLNLRAPSTCDDEGLCCWVLVLEGSKTASSAPYHSSLSPLFEGDVIISLNSDLRGLKALNSHISLSRCSKCSFEIVPLHVSFSREYIFFRCKMMM